MLLIFTGRPSLLSQIFYFAFHSFFLFHDLLLIKLLDPGSSTLQQMRKGGGVERESI